MLVANELVPETAEAGVVSSSLDPSISKRSLIHEASEVSDTLFNVRGSSGEVASGEVMSERGGDNGTST